MWFCKNIVYKTMKTKNYFGIAAIVSLVSGAGGAIWSGYQADKISANPNVVMCDKLEKKIDEKNLSIITETNEKIREVKLAEKRYLEEELSNLSTQEVKADLLIRQNYKSSEAGWFIWGLGLSYAFERIYSSLCKRDRNENQDKSHQGIGFEKLV